MKEIKMDGWEKREVVFNEDLKHIQFLMMMKTGECVINVTDGYFEKAPTKEEIRRTIKSLEQLI